jgi:site-specific DNA-methyltransferase (adenine-specific)
MANLRDWEGRVWTGDCLGFMAVLPDNSVDAVVTDPPYGLEFMGKEWDRLSGDVIDDPASVGGFQDGAGGNPYSRSRIRYGVGPAMQG